MEDNVYAKYIISILCVKITDEIQDTVIIVAIQKKLIRKEKHFIGMLAWYLP